MKEIIYIGIGKGVLLFVSIATLILEQDNALCILGLAGLIIYGILDELCSQTTRETHKN